MFHHIFHDVYCRGFLTSDIFPISLQFLYLAKHIKVYFRHSIFRGLTAGSWNDAIRLKWAKMSCVSMYCHLISTHLAMVKFSSEQMLICKINCVCVCVCLCVCVSLDYRVL